MRKNRVQLSARNAMYERQAQLQIGLHRTDKPPPRALYNRSVHFTGYVNMVDSPATRAARHFVYRPIKRFGGIALEPNAVRFGHPTEQPSNQATRQRRRTDP
ncbi:hypothetical protein [Azoarcus taiwanensis]|uniref:hypothetical protein n=1 Tax=Azoarcus taiwanensis TaxID=666964 RepID=UPI001FE28CA7|nr:hypothetical protein [Azoarcus taiwanensis]